MLRISGYSKRRKITKIEIHIIKKDYRTRKFQISGFCNLFFRNKKIYNDLLAQYKNFK